MPALDTSVKYFSSGMAGAPTMNNTAAKLITVLDACLVDGFGVKTVDSIVVSAGIAVATISSGHSFVPNSVALVAGATPVGLNGEHKVISTTTTTVTFDAFGIADGAATGTITIKLASAGWEKAFTGTNKAVYRAPNIQGTRMFLRILDSGTNVARCWGYEDMTDVDTGLNMFPTGVQLSGGQYVFKAKSATNSPWFVIANDRIAYFGVSWDASGYYSVYSFGDIVPTRTNDPYRFCLMAMNSDQTGWSQSGSYNPIGSTDSGYRDLRAARSYTAIGGSVGLSLLWFGGQATCGIGTHTFPNPEDNAILFTPIWVREGSSFRGRLPGIYCPPQSISTTLADQYVLDNIDGFDRKLVYRWQGGSGGLFFDVTGPWEF